MDTIKTIGKIVGIKDPIIEVDIVGDPKPKILDVLASEKDNTIRMQVVKSLSEYRYYCLCLSDVKAICRGDRVFNTGEQLKVPVGKELLGRIINVFGDPKDGLGPVETKENRSIYSDPPKYTDVNDKFEFLETGIKIVDLYAPLVKGGKVGLFGGSGVGKTVLLTEILHNIINKDREKNVSVFC